ncbi:MAG: hypothetical protein ABL892_07490 [Thiobacillaceae bacterium]
MEFQPVAIPQSESELAVMLSLLDAHEIPYFVQNRGFGGLYPGMQLHIYNVQRVMVPINRVSEATDLLSVFTQPTTEPGKRLGLGDKLRVVAELLLGGWAVPSRREYTQKKDNENA